MNETMKESEKVLESDLPFREKLGKLLFITDAAKRKSGMELFQDAMGFDPVIQKMLAEYYQTRTEPFILRLVELGKKEGCINRELSNEAIRLFIGALQNVLARLEISKDVKLDLDALFFYGLEGKP